VRRTGSRSGRLRRPITSALVTVAAVGALPIGAAHAQTATPPPARSIDAVCANMPARYDPFDDIAANTFTRSVRCLAFAGITSGVAPARYAPERRVTRAQMASLLARMIDSSVALGTSGGLQALPGHDGTNTFTDVAGNNVHVGNINRLADAGIALGGPGGLPATSFAPERPVTREQMASLITRSLTYLTGAPVVSANDYFVDDDTSVHQRNINALAEAGIAVGDGVDRFGPGQFLDRGQMSAFLMRSMAKLEADGSISPVPDRTGAVFPFVADDLRFDEPLAAAEAYAERYLGFADPVYSEFRQADSRSGEVGVRPRADGPETVFLLRQLDDTWWILGTTSDAIIVDRPEAGAVLSSPVSVQGRAHTFEGVVDVQLWTDRADEPLAMTTVTGGGTELAPFEGTLTFDRRPATRSGALILRSYGGEAGGVWQATVLRVHF
jgi:hypothetical protein